MHKLLLDIPGCIETERLYIRCYKPGDGKWYFAMSQKNRKHLAQFESENVVMGVNSEEEAEILVRDLAAEWTARNCFFMGAFDKKTDEFIAQIYIGPVNWKIPEFQIGYFVDVDHEGQGYVTEAVKAALRFIFKYLKAHRVRLECDDTNVRSYRVAERCGMVREGYFRENKKNPDGSFSGTLHYGILSKELDALNYRA
ncbi:MAG: GNAT family N-acetyltransferase [candidate division Zixibacteria bacterium]|nr:GNAT family N-acetyltransferase [candidate division Zixibacteria bacterium]